MARTSTYHAYDRLLGGRLGAILLDPDKTVEDLLFELRSEHDIRVSTNTVYRWISIAQKEAAGAAS